MVISRWKNWRNWLIGPILEAGSGLENWDPKNYEAILRHYMVNGIFGGYVIYNLHTHPQWCSTHKYFSHGEKINSVGAHMRKLCLS
jgi:hypothetical protein